MSCTCCVAQGHALPIIGYTITVAHSVLPAGAAAPVVGGVWVIQQPTQLLVRQASVACLHLLPVFIAALAHHHVNLVAIDAAHLTNVTEGIRGGL